MQDRMAVFFHSKQLEHKPLYEWTKGEKLSHPETTYRAEKILEALNAEPTLFSMREPAKIRSKFLRQAHDQDLITILKASEAIPPQNTFYPSVFPKRHHTKADPKDIRHAGYFCFDSGTPLTNSTWSAAVLSASCAHEASLLVESGKARAAYALCRPPGHHASRDLFGGYCYFNNAAIIAKRLRERMKIAILDIDFHHGNGTQDMFYNDDRVLFVSIHGDPKEFYPYYTGSAEEKGKGCGEGFNFNIPLPRGCDGQEYIRQIQNKVVPTLEAFSPGLLIISAGFDTYRKDPIGAFTLDTPDYHVLGEHLARLGFPTVIIQEGGYCVDELGVNVATFLRGFRDGIRE